MVAKKKAKTPKKIWYISRFRQRYELADNVRFDRKSPLKYTKDFVGSGSDNESCTYWRQLMALRSKQNWLMLRGAFAELKNIAGNVSKAYRGYLLNKDFEPATEKEIGRWLGVDEKRAKQILTELEDVGLLERVNLPKFDTGDDEKKKKKSSKKKTTKKTERARKSTRKSERTRAPLKKKVKAKAKIKVNVKNKANGNIGNGNSKRNNKSTRQKGRKHKDNAPDITGYEAAIASAKRSKAALAPTTTPPIKPQVADAGGSRVIPFKAPLGSDKRIRNPKTIGHIVQGMMHKYDKDAQVFAFEIYETLGIAYALDLPEASREIGCFASAWAKAKQTGLPPPVLDELYTRAVAEAGKIAKRRRQHPQRCNKPGAVWRTVFKRLLNKRCTELQCKAM